MRKSKDLEHIKQIAKQLFLHRVWNGKSQSEIAEIIDVSFQQYQKIERCENRMYAEQLIKICQNQKWDIEIIANADPHMTLNEWDNVSEPKQRSGIKVNYQKILNKFDKIDLNAYKNYYRIKNQETILPMKGE